MKRFLLWGLSVAFMIISACLAVMLLDAAVSLDHSRERSSQLNQRSQLAIYFVKEKWIGQSMTDVVSVAENFRGESLVIKKNENENEIEVGEMTFFFKDEKVVDVKYFDQYEE